MKRGRKSSNNTFTENGKKIWKCGKYKRLSKEDGHDVSYSIENQDAILDYYLANHPEIQVVDNIRTMDGLVLTATVRTFKGFWLIFTQRKSTV